jgi:putative copper export protein
MQWTQDKQHTVLRLAACGAAGLVVYAAAGERAEHLPVPEKYRHWLREHRIQAAAGAAILVLAASLALFPPPHGEEEAPEEPYDPCEGYERTDV